MNRNEWATDYLIGAEKNVGSAPPLPPIDTWQHRSEKMRCKSCMWFAPKAGDVGRCRRHAPTMNGYPVVFVSDWCGDHKLNEVAGSRT